MHAAVLGGTSDAISQVMHGLPVDCAHVTAMTSLACILSGVGNAFWMRFLEDHIPGGCPLAVSLKTVADFCCCATLFNSAFLVGVPFLTTLIAHHDAFLLALSDHTAVHAISPPAMSTLLDPWTPEDFQSLMRLEACTFVPYNLFAFRVVPPQLRPLGSASLSAVSTIVVSSITLGFEPSAG
uniref:Uncharacterized protein n=1 Tax=Haptolina brevifila TaxID=156173 RepID=A0A7S2ING3_9EUKA